jgi:2-succinyl-6-hydroxy-2,4-cyclohexadiene-1-carboxylate synthase
MSVGEVRLRDGLRLHVRAQGSGDALLLVHGFTGSGDAWGQPLIDALAESSRVLLVDLIGHGASDRPLDPARYALPRQVDDLCEVLDAYGATRALWLGYSMGGRIALAAAVERPERVAGLVLESASPGLARTEERAARRASDEARADALERDGIEAFVDTWLQQPLFSSQARLEPTVQERERRRRRRADPAALAASLRGAGTGAQRSYWPDLPHLAVPLSLVTGSEDTKFTAIAQQMLELAPRSRHRVIPEAGHATHLEQPARFVAEIHPLINGGVSP